MFRHKCHHPAFVNLKTYKLSFLSYIEYNSVSTEKLIKNSNICVWDPTMFSLKVDSGIYFLTLYKMNKKIVIQNIIVTAA
jgi:hypothetical protein